MRQTRTVSAILAALLLAGCSGSPDTEQRSTRERSVTVDVPGYSGGCKAFTIFSQNQFAPFGTSVRRALDQEGESVGLRGNDELTAAGWTRTNRVFYPGNPEGLRGEVWFYVPSLGGWVPDAGARSVRTRPSPGNRDADFDPHTQAAPQPPECELFLR